MLLIQKKKKKRKEKETRQLLWAWYYFFRKGISQRRIFLPLLKVWATCCYAFALLAAAVTDSYCFAGLTDQPTFLHQWCHLIGQIMSYKYCWKRATSFRLPSRENMPKFLSFPLKVPLWINGATNLICVGWTSPSACWDARMELAVTLSMVITACAPGCWCLWLRAMWLNCEFGANSKGDQGRNSMW